MLGSSRESLAALRAAGEARSGEQGFPSVPGELLAVAGVLGGEKSLRQTLADAGQPEAIVLTGSFNFTHSAQYRNAENLLILRGNPVLAERYAADWQRHHAHAVPVRK